MSGQKPTDEELVASNRANSQIQRLLAKPDLAIPALIPPSRQKTSPVKRHRRKNSNLSWLDNESLHTRTRSPLLLGHPSGSGRKSSSLLDDFELNHSNEDIELFAFPELPPPQNMFTFNSSSFNSELKKNNRSNNRDIFQFEQNRDGSSVEADMSIFSMLPKFGSSPAFDFNSYLRSVTSRLDIIPKMAQNCTRNSIANLLDLSNPTKVDLSQSENQLLVDDLELDCVVRSNTWDSDIDTEDELELDLDLEKGPKYEFITNTNTDERMNFSNAPRSNKMNTTESQIPSFYDPFNKVINSKRSNLNRNVTLEMPSNSGLPMKIYSDTSRRSKSPVSLHRVEDTLFVDNLPGKRASSEDPVEPALIAGNSTNCVSSFGEENSSLPHHHLFVTNLKSAFKPIPKSLLNMVVESSDGSLEDATKYATEINAQNSEGIPIPEKTTEIVNIPTTGPTVNGIRKSAIIRGVRAKTNIKKKINKDIKEINNDHNDNNAQNHNNNYDNNIENNDTTNSNTINKERKAYFNTLTERREALSLTSNYSNRQNISSNGNLNNFKGFYSFQEKQQFLRRNVSSRMNSSAAIGNKENECIGHSNHSFKRARIDETHKSQDFDGKKRVNWADSLEW